MEPLRRTRRGSFTPPVPDASPQRGGGVDRMPDGPRETPNLATDQKPCVASALPRPTADDDPATATPDVRQWHRLRAHHPNRLLLYVQHHVDAVLFVMRISPAVSDRGRIIPTKADVPVREHAICADTGRSLPACDRESSR